MSNIVHPHVLESVGQLAHEWKHADPYPHIVIDEFFSADFCASVLRDFPPFEKGCALNEQGLPGGKATFEDVRSLGPTYRALDDHIQSRGFLKMMSTITGIPDLLYDPDYIGGGTHENRNLQELDAHVDFNYHPRRGWHRRCNLIVYLNPDWQESWGGSLEIHSNPWTPEQDRVKTVLPIRNRAVLFETSECSWHAFRRITPPLDKSDMSRRSFAIYLYTKDRPKELTAPPHATVYVERPLPKTVKAGAPLRPSDADAIERLVNRRVQHARRIFEREQKFALDIFAELARISGQPGTQLSEQVVADLQWLVGNQDQGLKFLYDRETSFTERLERLRHAPALWKARGGFPLYGAAVLHGKPQGIWDDGWVGNELRCTVETTSEVKLLEVRGLFPEGTQRAPVEIEALGQRFTAKAMPGPFVWSFPLSIPKRTSAPLAIRTSATFRPSAKGASSDARDLAFLLSAVYFE